MSSNGQPNVIYRSPILFGRCTCDERYNTIRLQAEDADDYCQIIKQECSYAPLTHPPRYACLTHEQVFKSLVYAKKHASRKRKATLLITEQDTQPAAGPDDFFGDTESNDKWPRIKTFLDGSGFHPSICRYIADEYNAPLTGCRMIVKRAFGSPDNLLPSLAETFFHLMMAGFLLSLNESQRETFIVLVRIIHESAVSQTKSSLA